MLKRAFEKISEEQWFLDTGDLLNYKNIELPRRATDGSSGYDIKSPISFIIPKNGEIVMPTGIRAFMHKDEELKVYIRSSLGIKRKIQILNCIPKIDSDYVNGDNEGHIFIAFKNEGKDDWIVNVGDRVCQASFYKYLITDDDYPVSDNRTGGIGSTGT
jgi:dUTP pyrophosphatase